MKLKVEINSKDSRSSVGVDCLPRLLFVIHDFDESLPFHRLRILLRRLLSNLTFLGWPVELGVGAFVVGH